MSRSQSVLLQLELADSGVVSTTPSELNDPIDRDDDFAISQEDDPGLGSTISPKRSSDMGNGGVSYSKLLSSTSAANHFIANHATPAAILKDELSSVSDKSLVRANEDAVLPPPNLVTMASSSTTSGTSIAVAGGTEE